MNSLLSHTTDAVPFFPVTIAAPDLSGWRVGNTGLPGFWSFTAAIPGPHVALTALMHGNEIAGARVLADLLAAGVRPTRGRLTLGFANLDYGARRFISSAFGKQRQQIERFGGEAHLAAVVPLAQSNSLVPKRSFKGTSRYTIRERKRWITS